MKFAFPSALLTAATAGIAYAYPSVLTFACAVFVACMFVFTSLAVNR